MEHPGEEPAIETSAVENEVRETGALDRVGRVARVVATSLSIAGLWVLLVYWWVEEAYDSAAYHLAFAVGALLLAGVTAFYLASFRFPRLRTALLPIELAFIVGMSIFASGTRGSEVVTTGDAAGVATMFAAGAVVALSFLSVLLHERQSRGRWLAGVAVFLAAFGIAVPLLLDVLDGTYAELAVDQREIDAFEVMSLHAGPGQVSLGRNALSPGGSGSGDATSVDVPVFVELRADGAGALVVSLGGGASALVDQRVELRHGPCHAPGAIVGSWGGVKIPSVPPARQLPVTGLALDDLSAEHQMHVRAGSGAPLDDVSCADVLSSSRLVLARSGAAAFFAACVDPLKLARADVARLREDSLQDAGCARRMRELVEVARAPVFHTRAQAEAQATCMNQAPGTHVRAAEHVAGSWTLVPFDAPDERAMNCAMIGTPVPDATSPARAVDPGTGEVLDLAGSGYDDGYGGVAAIQHPGSVDPVTGAPADWGVEGI